MIGERKIFDYFAMGGSSDLDTPYGSYNTMAIMLQSNARLIYVY